MQDLKLNGIYIAKSGQLFHNYQKLKVLEITTNTYYIHWLDADNEVRYHKREFASYYEIVETLEEPKLTEPTTNHLAENFIDITNKELKNNENKTSEYLIRQQNSYMMNKAYKNRYLLGEFEKNENILYSLIYVTNDYKQGNSIVSIEFKNSLEFLILNDLVRTRLFEYGKNRWFDNNKNHSDLYNRNISDIPGLILNNLDDLLFSKSYSNHNNHCCYSIFLIKNKI